MGAGSFILPSSSGEIPLPDEGTFTWGKLNSSYLRTQVNPMLPIYNVVPTTFTSLEGNYSGFLAIKSDGTMWGISNGINNIFGVGSSTSYQTWTQIGVDTNWLKISVGYGHSLAIKTDGTLWVTGDNAYGQLGDGNQPTDVTTWTQVGVDTDWEDVSAGYQNSITIKNGELYTCGRNTNYATGLNTIVGNTITWTKVGVDTDWSSVHSKYQGGFAIKTTGTLYGWGNGNNYVLGNNISGNFTVPTQIGVLTDWLNAKIRGGVHASIVLKSTGALYTCGINTGGVTGQGTSMGHTQVWTQIGVDTDWEEIGAAVYDQNIAYQTIGGIKGGKIYMWGNNGNGSVVQDIVEVGTIYTTPQQITNKTNWKFIRIGYAEFIAHAEN